MSSKEEASELKVWAPDIKRADKDQASS